LSMYPDYFYFRSKLGGALHELAGLQKTRGNLPEAWGLYEQAMACQKRALAAQPANGFSRFLLRNHYVALSEVLLHLGRHADAALAATVISDLRAGQGEVALEDGTYAAGILARCARIAVESGPLPDSERTTANAQYLAMGDKLLTRIQQCDPKEAEVQNNIAWLFATCPEAKWRDPARALMLSERAI